MTRIGRAWQRWRRKFDLRVSQELIADYQRFYYPMIMCAGLYCAFVAEDQAKGLDQLTGSHVAFIGWLALNIVCPIGTLIGRRIFARSATKRPGEANQAPLGAYLQLWCDGGVWAAILIYFACWFMSFHWGDAMYTTWFFLMGLPGGFLFTYRSWQRVHGMERRRKRLRP